MGGTSPDVNLSELGQSDLDITPIDPDYDGASEGSAYEDLNANKTGDDMVNEISEKIIKNNVVIISHFIKYAIYQI